MEHDVAEHAAQVSGAPGTGAGQQGDVVDPFPARDALAGVPLLDPEALGPPFADVGLEGMTPGDETVEPHHQAARMSVAPQRLRPGHRGAVAQLRPQDLEPVLPDRERVDVEGDETFRSAEEEAQIHGGAVVDVAGQEHGTEPVPLRGEPCPAPVARCIVHHDDLRPFR